MQTQPKPVDMLSEEEQFDTDSHDKIQQHNSQLIRFYIKNSYFSILMFIIMLVMFIISVFMTYYKNVQTLQKYDYSHLNPNVLVKLGANAGFLAKQGEPYRLITAIFLHAGIQHFFINSISFFSLLMMVQGQFKKIVFILAFVVGGIQGNLASLIANFMKQNEQVVAIGASTSICSILGLYLASLYLMSLKNGTTSAVKKKISFMVAYLFFISVMPGIDFYGHFGSFIGGSLIGLAFSGVKMDYGDDGHNVKKLKLVCLIIYASYSILLLSIFFI